MTVRADNGDQPTAARPGPWEALFDPRGRIKKAAMDFERGVLALSAAALAEGLVYLLQLTIWMASDLAAGIEHFQRIMTWVVVLLGFFVGVLGVRLQTILEHARHVVVPSRSDRNAQ